MDQNQLPKHIFGMHDRGAEQFFTDVGKPGWIVLSKVATDGAENFADLSNAGHGVIVRLNNGYGSAGTIPSPSGYDAFAAACAQYAANSQGAHIWIIGNETNLASERPGNHDGQDGEPITPKLYAECFAKCRAVIRAVPGHEGDWVIPSPPGPWNAQTGYDGNPSGDWADYFRDLLNECVKRGAPPDALALHTYTLRDYNASLVTSEQRHDNPSHNTRHLHFTRIRIFWPRCRRRCAIVPSLLPNRKQTRGKIKTLGGFKQRMPKSTTGTRARLTSPFRHWCSFAGKPVREKPNRVGAFRTRGGWSTTCARRAAKRFPCALARHGSRSDSPATRSHAVPTAR